MLPRNIGWPQLEWISPETRRQRGMEDPITSDGSVIGAHVSLSHLLTLRLDGVHEGLRWGCRGMPALIAVSQDEFQAVTTREWAGEEAAARALLCRRQQWASSTGVRNMIPPDNGTEGRVECCAYQLDKRLKLGPTSSYPCFNTILS